MKNHDTIRHAIHHLPFLLFAALLLGACGVHSSDSGDSSGGGPLQVEGTIDNYDLGQQELYKQEDFVDLIEGTIESDGSFSVTFLEREEIEEALRPLGNSASEEFVGIYCRDEVGEALDASHRFVGVSVFNFTHGESNLLGRIGLTSDELNLNVFPPQSDARADLVSRWIYSSSDADVDLTCNPSSGGTASVDLDLEEGWNEIHFDVSDREDKVVYTGQRPSQVDWVMEE